MKDADREPPVSWLSRLERWPGLLLWASGFSLALHVLRCPRWLWYPGFWAEDGTIFFAQDYSGGFSVFLKTYAGYLHLWPRLVACLVGFLPMLWAPTTYKLFALITQAFLLFVIARPRFPGTRVEKALMMLATVLVPQGGEVFLNLTNTISVCCLIFLAIAVLAPAQSRVSKIWETLALFVCAGSGPCVLFLIPLIAVYFYLGRAPLRALIYRIWPLLAAFLIQLHYFDMSARGVPSFVRETAPWLRTYRNFFTPMILADVSISALLSYLASTWVVLCLGMFLGSSLKKGRPFPASAFLMVCGFTIYASCVFAQRNSPDNIHPFHGSARYSYLPYTLVFWAVILGVSHAEKTQEWLRHLRVVFLLVAVLSSAYYFTSMEPTDVLSWKKQVREFEAQGSYSFSVLPPPWKFHLNRADAWRKSGVD